MSEVSENNAKLYLQQQLLLIAGYKEEIDKMNLFVITNEEFQEILRDKSLGKMTDNGAKQRVIYTSEIEQYRSQGYEFQAVLPDGRAVMKLRF